VHSTVAAMSNMKVTRRDGIVESSSVLRFNALKAR
jgi:hypothetical protein